MNRLFTRFAAILLLAVMPVAVGLALFVQAGAQDTGDDSQAESLSLVGESGDTGTFQGSISGLVASEGPNGVLLDGVLNGLNLTDGTTVRVADQGFSVMVTPSVVGAEDPVSGSGADGCDVLNLEIEVITLDAPDEEITAWPVVIDANTLPEVSELVCSLADVLTETPDATADIASLLNEIFAAAGIAPAADDVTGDATAEVTEETTDVTEETTDDTGDTTDSTDDSTDDAADGGEDPAVDPTVEDEEPEPTEEDEEEEEDDIVLTPDDSDSTPD